MAGMGVREQLSDAFAVDPVLRPSELLVEARLNMRAVSRSAAETVPAEVVEDLLTAGAAAWLARCAAPATFYAWYDDQAGQLRYSLVSAAPHDLPFGALVRLLTEPHEVVDAFLSDSTPGLVFLEDSSDKANARSFEEPVAEIPVWTLRKAGRAHG